MFASWLGKEGNKHERSVAYRLLMDHIFAQVFTFHFRVNSSACWLTFEGWLILAAAFSSLAFGVAHMAWDSCFNGTGALP